MQRPITVFHGSIFRPCRAISIIWQYSPSIADFWQTKNIVLRQKCGRALQRGVALAGGFIFIWAL